MANGTRKKSSGILALLFGALVAIGFGFFLKAENGRALLDYWVDQAEQTLSEIPNFLAPKNSSDASSDNFAKKPETNLPKKELVQKEETTQKNLETEKSTKLKEVKPAQKPAYKEKPTDEEKDALAKKIANLKGKPEISVKVGKNVLNKKPKVSFSILRVERDGSTLIAGVAPPNSLVEVIEDEKAIASSKAAANGDFLALLDQPLKSGQHEFLVRATPPTGDPVTSTDTAVVVMPDKGSDVLAMISKDGEATMVFEKPTIKGSTDELVIKSKEIEETSIGNNDARVGSETEKETKIKKIVRLESAVERKLLVPTIDEKEISIGAMDVESNQYFIAGKSPAGKTVNIYIDNEFQGRTKTNKEGAFLFSKKSTFSPGRYTVRADMIDKSAKVTSRATVILEHEIEELAAIVPEKKPARKIDAPKITVNPFKPASNSSRQKQISRTEEVKSGSLELTQIQKDYMEETLSSLVEINRSVLPVIESGKSVIIRRGDSLWKISRRMLGKGHRYTTIFTANEDQISDPNLIFPGQVFSIPEEYKKSAG